MKYAAIFSMLLWVIGCRYESSPVTIATPERTAHMQSIVDSLYAAHPEVVGFLVHIEDPDEELSWSYATGYADKEAQTILTVDHPVLIASNTKTYVSATILRLVEEGRLKVEDAVSSHLPMSRVDMLKNADYDVEAMEVRHLMSHTSGINDYTTAGVFRHRALTEPTYRWTRDEQLKIALTDMAKLGDPGATFHYSDANYLLLSEIIEQLTGKPFYVAMADLVDYDKLGLRHTWFHTLEDSPEGLPALAKQYNAEHGFNNYSLDPSFDLYGGGGLASTARDMGRFYQALFTGAVFHDEETIDKMMQTMRPTRDSLPSMYALGIARSEVGGSTAYGHGGYWGSQVQYLTEDKVTIVVVVLERQQRHLKHLLIERLAQEL